MKLDNPEDPARITYITLISAIAGFLTYALSPFFLLLFASVLALPKIKSDFFSHLPTKVASFTATTFVFGLINGYTWVSLKQFWFGEVAEPPIFSLYLSLMTIYHYFEFQLINNFHHETLAWQCSSAHMQAFLIYHSQQYFLANLFSLTEHILQRYVFSFSFKTQHPLMVPAFFVSALGEGLRITAFFTCKSNFTHIVKDKIDRKHQLVTNGIYAWLRHPSYTGYFYFSVFGQIFIGNVISSIAFFFILSRFFNDRIYGEERSLLEAFPEYLQYKQKTYILIPFVKDPQFGQVSSEEEL